LVVSSGQGQVSRRRLVAGAGTALLLAGCGARDPTAHALRTLPQGPRESDVEILNHALDLEYRLIDSYAGGIPLLSGFDKKAAQRFLGQELSHAGELSGLVKEAKGQPIQPRTDYGLPRPGNAAEVLQLLHTLESGMITVYLDVIPRLAPGIVRASVASILANEAQHLAVVRSGQGLAPVPSAFVTGRE
jgi:hypothetical protein